MANAKKSKKTTLKTQDNKFNVTVSNKFTTWLKSHKASLAVTTYQVGKIIFFGINEQDKLWVYNRNVGKCLGLIENDAGFWVSSDTQLYRYKNILREGVKTPDGCDAYYAPRHSFFTGNLDIHDLGIDKDDGLIFINTGFNCLARPSREYSFEPIWSPPFIKGIVGEDRCHLNGLAMVDGKPGFVTAVSASDTFEGWREHRETGGVVVDVNTNEIICTELSMPHSPRWYKGRLWLHNSGKGEFGYVDLKSGKFEPVVFCPGYLRGLTFIGEYAIIGLSMPRDNKTFAGLPLDGELSSRKQEALCGLYVINLKSGKIMHSLVMEGLVSELYDVAVLPDVIQPKLLGPTSPEIKQTVSVK